MKRNKLGYSADGTLPALQGLLECPSLECVELTDNCLKDPQCVAEVFAKMPNLKCLYLNGNDVVWNIPYYRKQLIVQLPMLTYLDTRPVFDEDRRNAEAFMRGGHEEEREERNQIKTEEKENRSKNKNAFTSMMKAAKEEALLKKKLQ